MDDAGAMDTGHRIHHGFHNRERVPQLSRGARADPLRQGLAVEYSITMHGQPLVLQEIVERRDIGVLNACLDRASLRKRSENEGSCWVKTLIATTLPILA